MDLELVKNKLEEIGFQPEPLDNNEGFVVEYEDLRVLVIVNDADAPDFVRILVPRIYDIDDPAMRPMVLEVCNDVNIRIRYTKTLIANDAVWVTLEYRDMGIADLEEFLSFGIDIVAATTSLFYRQLQNPSSDDEETDDDGEED